MAGISEDTVSRGCQWQSISASYSSSLCSMNSLLASVTSSCGMGSGREARVGSGGAEGSSTQQPWKTQYPAPSCLTGAASTAAFVGFVRKWTGYNGQFSLKQDRIHLHVEVFQRKCYSATRFNQRLAESKNVEEWRIVKADYRLHVDLWLRLAGAPKLIKKRKQKVKLLSHVSLWPHGL